ncbi:MAG: hypothetical protein U5N55_03575 [Cypionkella sp.]|nr:hypothetical protein [Cypionkella sp.]
MDRQRIQWLEIDIPYCSRVWGVGACTAALSVQTPSKCRQTFATCGALAAFNEGTPKTLVLTPSVSGLPLGVWPVLTGDVDETEATVNIAGAEPSLSAFGRLGTFSVQCSDARSDDLWFDKYVSDRLSGAGRFDAVAFKPIENGTLFTKLRAWWPNFSGRPARVCDGWLENGVLTKEAQRHYLLTDFETDAPGRATFKGRSRLDLAGNNRALCPKPNTGKLATDIGLGIVSVALTPATVGAEYATEGRAKIGGEIVRFTRADDVVTLTGRGLSGTQESEP